MYIYIDIDMAAARPASTLQLAVAGRVRLRDVVWRVWRVCVWRNITDLYCLPRTYTTPSPPPSPPSKPRTTPALHQQTNLHTHHQRPAPQDLPRRAHSPESMALVHRAHAPGLDNLLHALLAIQPRAAALRELAALQLDRLIFVDASARPYRRHAETHGCG